MGVLWKVLEKMVGGPGFAHWNHTRRVRFVAPACTVIGGLLGALSAVPTPWGISFGFVVGAGSSLLLTLLVLAILD